MQWYELLMDIRILTEADASDLWTINEECLPGVGQITQSAMADLVSLASLPMGAYQDDTLMGFVLCLPPGTRYASLNYAWFNERYDDFLYVDRIGVGQSHRDRSVGGHLYQRVIEEAVKLRCPIAAEINIEPPNPGSMRFHQRHGFEQVGTLSHGDKSVAMVMRPLS